MYNITFNESKTRNGICYLWGESEGNRGFNEIASILNMYLKEVDNRGNVSEVILYCDSCSCQNKNKAVLSMIYILQKTAVNIKHIKITFLLLTCLLIGVWSGVWIYNARETLQLARPTILSRLINI